MVSKPKPKAPRQKAPASDPYDRVHEALLIAAYDELPGLLADELHSMDGLNEALAGKATQWHDEIEKYIAEGKVQGAQVALWRAVPQLRFGHSGLDQPTVMLGHTLYRRFDHRGDEKRNPEPLCVIDFAVSIPMPSWDVGYLRQPDPKRPLKEPRDALDGFKYSATNTVALGLVLPSNITLGNAVRQIETIAENGRIDRIHLNWQRAERPFLIGVTDSSKLFALLSEKIDMLLVEPDGVSFDFGYLKANAR